MDTTNGNVVYVDEEIKVEQLLVGYFEETGAACGSITLIILKDYKILIDCGLPSTDFSTDLTTTMDPTNIDCLIVTHWHSDHCGQIHQFINAHQILPDDNHPAIKFSDIEQSGIENPKQKLELFKLSGHALVDLVLAIRPNSHTDELIVVTGDLFENEIDYYSDEPAVKGINNDVLIKNRQFIRELHPSIVIPGHGDAFRLRSTNSLMQEQRYGQVILKCLLPATSLYDSVWLLEANEHTILVNTHKDVELSSSIKGDKQLTAIVILNPSARSASAIGQFKAEKLYMSEDVLHSPNIYSQLNESEWLIDDLVRVSRGSSAMALKVEIFDAITRNVLRVIGE